MDDYLKALTKKEKDVEGLQQALERNSDEFSATSKEIERLRNHLRDLQERGKQLRDYIDRANAGYPDLPLDEKLYIKIPWEIFAQYAIENQKAWIYQGEAKLSSNRWFCKVCKGQRRIEEYELIQKYVLPTVSHGEWRICGLHLPYITSRQWMLCRPRSSESTRPDTQGALITINPYLYSDPEVVKDLLKMADQ